LPPHLFVNRYHESIIVGNFRVGIGGSGGDNRESARGLLMLPGKQNRRGQDCGRSRRPGTRGLPTAKQY